MAKVMISMPDELLDRVDERVRERGTSRSAFLRELAERELSRPDPDWLQGEVEEIRSWSGDEGAGDESAAKWIRRQREQRANRL